MKVILARTAGGATCTTLHRADGVVLELPGYDLKYRVPHDLAHVVTERALGMARGVFGSIAGGGVFDNMRVVGGRRPRHDAAERGRRLLAANKRELGRAELVSGIVHRGFEQGIDPLPVARREWHALIPEPFPWTEDEFRAAVAALTAFADDLARAGKIELTWPEDLASPMPPARDTHLRGRRGRDGRSRGHRGRV